MKDTVHVLIIGVSYRGRIDEFSALASRLENYLDENLAVSATTSLKFAVSLLEAHEETILVHFATEERCEEPLEEGCVDIANKLASWLRKPLVNFGRQDRDRCCGIFNARGVVTQTGTIENAIEALKTATAQCSARLN